MEIRLFFIMCLVMVIMVLAWVKGNQYVSKKNKEKKRQERLRKKGEEGELETKGRLEKVRGYKRLIHHVYVPKENGTKTTEIDLLLIHEKGIFIIENKNFQGLIYGKETEQYWTQVLEDGRKRSFYNPVKQNQSHIHHFRRMLSATEWSSLPCFSVITFNGGGRLKRIRVKKENVIVVTDKRLNTYLNRRLRHMKKVMDKKTVEKLYRYIQDHTDMTKGAYKQHRKQFKKKA